jgi:hypothetical protein
MIYGVQRKDFKKIRILLAAEEVFVPDMTHLKRCGSIGGAIYKRERLRRATCTAKKKDSVYPIGDGEKWKSQKFGQKKRGPRWDSNQNPRGYEQEIGPAQQRTGKHEPSSYACNRAHKSYVHQEKIKKPGARPKKEKRGSRWDSNQNPRGYEQEIGPAQQRTGKHEPPNPKATTTGGRR